MRSFSTCRLASWSVAEMPSSVTRKGLLRYRSGPEACRSRPSRGEPGSTHLCGRCTLQGSAGPSRTGGRGSATRNGEVGPLGEVGGGGGGGFGAGGCFFGAGGPLTAGGGGASA